MKTKGWPLHAAEFGEGDIPRLTGSRIKKMTQKSVEISIKKIKQDLEKIQQITEKRLIVDSFSSHSLSEEEVRKILGEMTPKKEGNWMEEKEKTDSNFNSKGGSSSLHSNENDLMHLSGSSLGHSSDSTKENEKSGEWKEEQLNGEFLNSLDSSKEEEKTKSYGKMRIDITAKVKPLVELVDIEYTKTQITEAVQWDIDFNTPDGFPLTASVVTPFTRNHSWKRHSSLSNRIRFSHHHKDEPKISSLFRTENRIKEPSPMRSSKGRLWKRTSEASERALYDQNEPDINWFSNDEDEFKESFSLQKEGLSRTERGEGKGKYLFNALEHPRLWNVEVNGPMDLSLTHSAKTKVEVFQKEKGRDSIMDISPLSDIRIKENVVVNVKGISELKIIGPFDLKITKDFGNDGKSDFSSIEFNSESPVDVDGDRLTIIPSDPLTVNQVESDFYKFSNSTHFTQSQFGGSLRIETADSLFNVIKQVNENYPTRSKTLQRGKGTSLFASPESDHEKGKWEIFERVNQLRVKSITLIHVFFKTIQTGGSIHHWESTLMINPSGKMSLTSLKETKFPKNSALITINPNASINQTVMSLVLNFRPNASIQYID